MTRSVAALIDRGRLARTWPFAAIAAAGQISAIWPPGPSNIWLFSLSTALLVLAALLLFVRVPAGREPAAAPGRARRRVGHPSSSGHGLAWAAGSGRST